MSPVFPALFLGGPPHSGKSTLTYRLSHALRQHEPPVPHYALRASPDGEGDWLNESPQALVDELRMRAKSDWTPQLASQINQDIDNRHMPLLVDAGGKVSPETETIAAACTHAILLAANPSDLAPWREMVARQGLVLVADLHSVLAGPQHIAENGVTLRGTISGLGRERSSEGPVFAALVQRLVNLCSYDTNELYRAHLNMTDVEMVINVEQPIHPLPARTTTNWQPADLPLLLESLPNDTPLGIYGRGPAWLYAAIALANYPHELVLYDIRQGWVTPPPLTLADTADTARLCWDKIVPQDTYTHVQFSVPGSYLHYREAAHIPVPIVDSTRGVLLDGRLPLWMWAALARTYVNRVAWIGTFYPRLGCGVVVWSADAAVAVGRCVENGAWSMENGACRAG
jgi:CRISPR-associated protein Csx3